MSGSKRRIVRRSRKGQNGSTVVEFAIVAPLLFFVICMIIDLGLMFWVNLTMQYAVHEGARYAVTGQSNLDPNAASQQRYLAVIQDIEDASMGLYTLVNPAISVTVNGVPAAYGANMFGGPGDLIVLQLNCAWPLLTPLIKPFFTGGQYSFTVAATMRNEGY
ncbi:pilus assembly protein [Paraburkholderia madseniana]|uniref:Pilus assembly protein n=1 Tax=Paraburkholderia madseniana TaxID=2599607 RepID=A0A6N6WDT5_9BURK|nr:TadE/TadG family type IV pilus assembly protein [Paraburkholderia madseniana]KAE8758673.1 pilus assembly protein [Paraburkholderia madseniana]